MAPKRPAPAEDPPAPSSTSEEEENEEEEEEEEEEESSPEESSEEEEEGEENKSAVLTPPTAVDKKAPSNKLVAATPTKSTTQSSSEDEEDGSESESESDSPPKKARSSRGADPTIKPIATKPMEETPKSKKARSKPGVSVTPSPVKSSTSKRPSEIGVEGKESKRAKKKDPEAEEEEGGKKSGDDSKKQMFQRIWSEEDEIGILKGMADYSAKNGCVPYPNGDMNEFHDFIKNSLHGDFSRVQLTDKARRLKKKYENNVARSKSGEDPTFQKPHEQRAFELSKKIWGGEGNSAGVQQSNKANGKARKNQKSNKAVKVEDVEVLSVINGDAKEAVKLENEPKPEPPKKYSLVISDFTRINESVGLSSSMDRAIEIGLGLLTDPVKAELKEKWKLLEDEEFQLYMKKLELIQMEARVAMQAYRSRHQ